MQLRDFTKEFKTETVELAWQGDKKTVGILFISSLRYR